MRRLVLAPEAEDALQEIALYTLERWGEAQARDYIAGIREACVRLLDNPSMGRLRRKTGAAELREIQVGSHVVIYAPRRDHVLIVGVLHEAMDLPRRRRELMRRMRSRGLI
jgi:plasmid stabilization system protein ParE